MKIPLYLIIYGQLKFLTLATLNFLIFFPKYLFLTLFSFTHLLNAFYALVLGIQKLVR